MRTLIDGMLQLARLDSGGPVEPAAPFDLAAVAAEVVAALPAGRRRAGRAANA